MTSFRFENAKVLQISFSRFMIEEKGVKKQGGIFSSLMHSREKRTRSFEKVVARDGSVGYIRSPFNCFMYFLTLN